MEVVRPQGDLERVAAQPRLPGWSPCTVKDRPLFHHPVPADVHLHVQLITNLGGHVAVG